MKYGPKPVLPLVIVLAQRVTVPFVVAHRKADDLLKLNRLPLTLSSDGTTLKTKLGVINVTLLE